MTDTNDLDVKMLALLERAKLIFEAGEMSGATAANLYDDIKGLLKEAKEVKNGKH